MGFTKLSDKILMSSVFQEDEITFKVWIALLASCKQDGISPATIPFLACICKSTSEIIMTSIEKLSSPDKYSTSENDDGRRIKKIDGGFYIINYLKYREYSYSDNPEAIKKRNQRGHLGDIKGHVPKSRGHSASASASNSASESEENKSVERRRDRHSIPPTVEEITAYCTERKNSVTAKTFFDHYQARGWQFKTGQKMKDWQAAIRTWESHNYSMQVQAPPPKPKQVNWKLPDNYRN